MPRVASSVRTAGVVEECRRGPRVDLARLPAARAAIETCGVWIVLRLTAVPDEQDEARKIACEAHGSEHSLGERASLGHAEGATAGQRGEPWFALRILVRREPRTLGCVDASPGKRIGDELGAEEKTE